jgi:hypothetical protein
MQSNFGTKTYLEVLDIGDENSFSVFLFLIKTVG